MSLLKSKSKASGKKKRLPPLAYIFLSFALVIFIGSLLLLLPFSASSPQYRLSYIDALFLATSAVCVTGLTTVTNLAAALSPFGKTIIGLLMQIGGLGLVTIVAFIMLALRRKINYSQAIVVREALNQSGMAELKKIVKHIIIITFCFELAGTIMNMFVFTNDYPFWEAFGISLFHAVSSFNNAGFDIIGSSSLEPYKDSILLNVSTITLIVGGGIGFLVYEDFIHFHGFRHLSVQTKVVLITNISLLFFSILIIKGIQWNSITWLQAVFYGVTTRTAGFSTFNLKNTLHSSGELFTLLLMFVGGSPMSTAGGIKTTTFFVLITSVLSYAKGKNNVVFKREIARNTQIKAQILLASAISLILIATIGICLFENDRFEVGDVIFEVFSAFGTVGLSMGITSLLGPFSKAILIIMMYLGRIGPVSVLNSWNPSLNKPTKEGVSYLHTDIMIG